LYPALGAINFVAFSFAILQHWKQDRSGFASVVPLAIAPNAVKHAPAHELIAT
jgi:hypothetical protein